MPCVQSKEPYINCKRAQYTLQRALYMLKSHIELRTRARGVGTQQVEYLIMYVHFMNLRTICIHVNIRTWHIEGTRTEREVKDSSECI